MPSWLLIVGVSVAILCFAAMPWAKRFDKRWADRREADGKSRSIVPVWVAVALAFIAIIAGIVLYNIP